MHNFAENRVFSKIVFVSKLDKSKLVYKKIGVSSAIFFASIFRFTLDLFMWGRRTLYSSKTAPFSFVFFKKFVRMVPCPHPVSFDMNSRAQCPEKRS